MADTNTTITDLLKMETGTHDNDWGTNLNTVLDNIETMTKATRTTATTGGTTTLTKTTAREPFHRVTGVLISNAVIEIPVAAAGYWFFKNETTGAFTLTVKVTGQTGVAIVRGETRLVRGNGTDIVDGGIPTQADVQSTASATATTVAGTVDAVTATYTPTLIAYPTKGMIRWVSGGANTVTAPTFNADTIGVKTIKKGASAALAVGDLGASGYLCEAYYNGTDLILQNPATEIQSTTLLTLTTGPICTPGGRLTLTSAAPVLTADVTGATTVYYTPYLHNFLMIYSGTSYSTRGFVEMSQTLADTTKSPVAATASNAYDVFVWDDAGTLRATRGPSWASGAVAGSNTQRGTGVGSTDLVRVNGVWMNANAITNGPAAQRGVFVGSFITNASNQVDWVCNPAAAAGGGNARAGLWNMYNRVRVSASNKDSANSWVIVPANTWTPANNSTSNRFTVFAGLSEDFIEVCARSFMFSGGRQFGSGVGLNSTTAISGFPAFLYDTGACEARYVTASPLGLNYFQWLEQANSASTTLYGDNNTPLLYQSGLTATFMA